jgi:hypothetical protein
MPDSLPFDADIAECYGWANRALDDDALDTFVDTLVQCVASCGGETPGAAKSRINRFGMQTASGISSRMAVTRRPQR